MYNILCKNITFLHIFGILKKFITFLHTFKPYIKRDFITFLHIPGDSSYFQHESI
jgi:hypothetical protein